MVITMKKENILISLLLLCPILVLIGVFIWGIQEKRTPREVFLKNQIKKGSIAFIDTTISNEYNYYYDCSNNLTKEVLTKINYCFLFYK